MGKSIAKNAAFNVLYKALTVIFPLITITYASRILGPSGIGKVSSAQNIVTYFTMFASLGIPQYGVRAIVFAKKDVHSCDRTFTELFVINTISSLICSALYFGLIFGLNLFDDSIKLNVAFSSLIILNIFNIDWVYRAFEEYKYIAIRSFIIKLISLVLLIVLIRDKSDIILYACIVCFGTVGNYILNIIQLKKIVNFRFNELHIFKHLKPIMTFFAAVIAVELYSLIDVTMLTYMTASENVGYYSNAAKIIKTFAATITAIGAVLLPRLSLYFSEKRIDETEKIISKILKVIILLTIPSVIGVLLTSEKIVLLAFGKEFLPAARTLCVLSPLILFMPLSGGIGAQILQTTNNEKLYMYSVCMGAGANFILNSVLIRFFQQNGAALASAITECLVTVVMLYYSSKIIHIRVEKNFILTVCGASAVMGCVVYLVDKYIVGVSEYILLIVEIIIGCISYFGILLVTRSDLLIEGDCKIRKKQRNR